MNFATILVLLLLALSVVLAVHQIRKKKLLHSCGGDCSHCASGCKKKEN